MARGRGGGFCVVEMGEVLVFMSGRDELCICGGGVRNPVSSDHPGAAGRMPGGANFGKPALWRRW